MTEPDGIRSGSPGQEVTGPWCGEGSGKGLAIRHSGDVLLGGAPGAGGLAGQFGTENGPVAYARFILAPGPHAAVAAAQVVM